MCLEVGEDASLYAREDFPIAVGPAITTIWGLDLVGFTLFANDGKAVVLSRLATGVLIQENVVGFVQCV